MRMKKTVFLFFCLVCIGFLSSCAKQKQYLLKYEDFKYNHAVSWDSSYSDVLSIYGSPDQMELGGRRFVVTYLNQSVVGYDEFMVKFFFIYETGLLDEILVKYELPTDNSSAISSIKKVHLSIHDGLVNKYGEPTKTTLSDTPAKLFLYEQWNDVIEDTRISIDTESHVQVSINGNNPNKRGTSCAVVYDCLRKNEHRTQHSDVFPLTPSPVPVVTPTPTPIPPSPTPTINTNGL